MKVTIIESRTNDGFEYKLNDALKDKNPDDIIDIKYSTAVTSLSYGSTYYSAMIIWRDENGKNLNSKN